MIKLEDIRINKQPVGVQSEDIKINKQPVGVQLEDQQIKTEQYQGKMDSNIQSDMEIIQVFLKDYREKKERLQHIMNQKQQKISMKYNDRSNFIMDYREQLNTKEDFDLQVQQLQSDIFQKITKQLDKSDNKNALQNKYKLFISQQIQSNFTEISDTFQQKQMKNFDLYQQKLKKNQTFKKKMEKDDAGQVYVNYPYHKSHFQLSNTTPLKEPIYNNNLQLFGMEINKIPFIQNINSIKKESNTELIENVTINEKYKYDKKKQHLKQKQKKLIDIYYNHFNEKQSQKQQMEVEQYKLEENQNPIFPFLPQTNKPKQMKLNQKLKINKTNRTLTTFNEILDTSNQNQNSNQMINLISKNSISLKQILNTSQYELQQVNLPKIEYCSSYDKRFYINPDDTIQKNQSLQPFCNFKTILKQAEDNDLNDQNGKLNTQDNFNSSGKPNSKTNSIDNQNEKQQTEPNFNSKFKSKKIQRRQQTIENSTLKSKNKIKKFPQKINIQQSEIVPFKFGHFDQIKLDIFSRRMFQHRDFNFKLNYGCFLFVKNQPECELTYKVFIGQGNNHSMIQRYFKQRWWWSIIDSDHKLEANFIWSQLKNNEYIYLQKECTISKEILEKQGIQNNNRNKITPIKEQFEQTNSYRLNSLYKTPKNKTPPKNRNNVFQMDNNNKILNPQDLSVFQKYDQKYGKKDEELKAIDFSYRLEFLESYKNKILRTINDPHELKCTNHFEFNWHLGNKKALFYNMRQYYELKNEYVFNYLPLTFHIIEGIEDQEFKNFQKVYYKQQQQILSEKLNPDNKNDKNPSKLSRNLWIIKPGEVTNRGKGIEVCEELSDIRRILKTKEKHKNGLQMTYIIQQYIQRPLLYFKRKFDIRCYILVSCMNGIIRAYWYMEGYIRTSSHVFNITDPNPLIHLTNDAIQKYGKNYGQYEIGNKLTFQDFQKYLDTQMPESKINFINDLQPKMKDIAADAIKATFIKLNPNRREFVFEVFGLDYMIDENFKVWLIEINTNPDITTSSPVCTKIIPPMVENALRIGLDPIFQAPAIWPPQKQHFVPDNTLELNKFQFIFDEFIDGYDLIKLYSGQSNYLDNIKEMEEEEEMISDEENNDQKD